MVLEEFNNKCWVHIEISDIWLQTLPNEQRLRSKHESIFLSRNIAACTFAEALHLILLSRGINWDFKEELGYDFYSQLEQKEHFGLI